MSVDRAKDIRRRLEAHCKSEKGYVDMQRLLIRFGMECFFRRLAVSPSRSDFVLKGAMLFAVHMDGPRNTKDADFQIYGRHDGDSIKRLFYAICKIEQDDALEFSVDRIQVEAAGEDREYPGYVVYVPAMLGALSMTLHFDIGFGEVITPEPSWTEIPSLLNLPKPRIKTYPIESVVAEKFEAIVRLGMRNGRMKDFYDLAEFAIQIQFHGRVLSEALTNTFAHRGMAIPSEVPIALTTAFYGKKAKVTAFNAFLQRHALPKKKTLDECCAMIILFLMPVCHAITAGTEFNAEWSHGEWKRL